VADSGGGAVVDAADQGRLFKLAVEALNVQMWYVPGEGFLVRVVARRQGDTWTEAERTEYTHLSAPELVDVVDSELGRLLGL
jgi:hypothetical protein